MKPIFEITFNFIFEKILVSLFRNTLFIDPKSTKGGDFYIDLFNELMERWSWRNGDQSPSPDIIREETIKRCKKVINELKKLENNKLIKIEKIENIKYLSTISNYEFKKLMYSYNSSNFNKISYKLSYINWNYFLKNISDIVASYVINEENIFSNKKQKKIIIEKIKEKTVFLEKTNDIILNSDNFTDVNLFTSLKELELDGLIVINGIQVISKEHNEHYINDTEFERYDEYQICDGYFGSSCPGFCIYKYTYKTNISCVPDFKLIEISENNKKDYIESLTCINPGFGSKFKIIINNNYSNPIEIDKNIKIWELLLQLSINGEIDYDKSFLDFINSNRHKLITKTGYKQTKIVKINNNKIVPNITIDTITEKAYKIKINKLNNN